MAVGENGSRNLKERSALMATVTLPFYGGPLDGVTKSVPAGILYWEGEARYKFIWTPNGCYWQFDGYGART